MISNSLRVFLALAIVLYFFIIIVLLKRRSLSLKYTLLWMLSGIAMSVLIVFPKIIDWIVYLVDIKSPVNGLFACGIFFILLILMSITSIVSKQSERVKELVQDNALLEKRIRELEQKVEKQ